MWLSDQAVKHPVFAIVVNLLIVAIGLVALDRLSLREYPDVNPPVVSIETSYTGASAKVIESRITKMLEERISGIEGIRYIESTSQDGQSSINIEFNTSRDIDAASNDVRDRIGRVAGDLPDGADAPEIFKVDSNNDVIMWLNLASNRMNTMQLTDYAKRYLVDKFSVIDGVARVRIGGEKRYAMRVWLNRKAMAARGVTVTDVENALRSENVELPAGRVESQQRELTVRVNRNYNNPEDFAKLVLARGSDGHLIRLGEIAKVVVGPENHRTELRGNKQNMIGIGIIKQSTANTLSVARGVKEELNNIQKTLPVGTKLIQSYDSSVFIEQAIHEVYITLAIAILLVILVIYLFLGNIRAMLIPAVTVPVSLVGAMIVLYALNFSLNLLTLLAFVLAIGLVVDDAIVVLENVDRRIHLREPPLLASYRGTRQVGMAVVATTLVLLAVFVPIAFLEGNIGRLFTEFAIAISAAVAFSSIVALTLTPVMCGHMLNLKLDKSRFKHFIDGKIGGLTNFYKKSLIMAMRQPRWILISFIVVAILAVLLYKNIPQEFVPQEDKGSFFVIVDGPEGASFSYMQDYMRKVENQMMELIDDGEAKRALSILPRGFGRFDAVNNGIGIVVLDHWDKRKRSGQEIVYELGQKLNELPGIRAFPVMRTGIGNVGTNQSVQFVIGGTSYDELARWRDVILDAARKNPKLLSVDSDYKETKPQAIIDIDQNRAAELGVSLHDIGRTLETMFGSREVTSYINEGEEYKVILEAEDQYKKTTKDLNNIYVRSTKTKKLIPLSNLVNIKFEASPAKLQRFNRLRSVTITANLAPGYTLGEALNFLENVVKTNLPQVTQIDYKGQSREFKDANVSMFFTFGLAILIMYLVLSAQFGSFFHPLIVLLAVPVAITGALFGLWICQSTLNIYSQIGMIMLLGLAAKNSILIIEFINQLRDQGVEFSKAVLRASITRFRPILMTALSTIFGSIPLILATGAGAQSRITIGIVIFFGVLVSSIFTIYIIPVFYLLIARNTKPRSTTANLVTTLDAQTPSKE